MSLEGSSLYWLPTIADYRVAIERRFVDNRSCSHWRKSEDKGSHQWTLPKRRSRLVFDDRISPMRSIGLSTNFVEDFGPWNVDCVWAPFRKGFYCNYFHEYCALRMYFDDFLWFSSPHSLTNSCGFEWQEAIGSEKANWVLAKQSNRSRADCFITFACGDLSTDEPQKGCSDAREAPRIDDTSKWWFDRLLTFLTEIVWL